MQVKLHYSPPARAWGVYAQTNILCPMPALYNIGGKLGLKTSHHVTLIKRIGLDREMPYPGRPTGEGALGLDRLPLPLE